MTDLEIRKVCAKALGWKDAPEFEGQRPNSLWPDEAFYHMFWDGKMESPDGKALMMPDPLHNDTQAMALEDYLISCGYLNYEDGNHMFYTWPLETGEFTFSADFNSKEQRRRAICECVAKLQQAK